MGGGMWEEEDGRTRGVRCPERLPAAPYSQGKQREREREMRRRSGERCARGVEKSRQARGDDFKAGNQPRGKGISLWRLGSSGALCGRGEGGRASKARRRL